MKILLVGDSFGADWTVKYSDIHGWVNMLAQEYAVDNQCLAGCSEYKIRNQLVEHLTGDVTHCIIVHTSPYRLPVKQHPLHSDDCLHHSCDFIYNDVANSKNSQVDCIKEYYEKYFYDEFFLYVHDLIINDIKQILQTKNVASLHMSFFPDSSNQFNVVDYNELFVQSPGLVNHLSPDANRQVFNDVKIWLSQN